VPGIDRFEGRSIFYTTFGETRVLQDLDIAVVGGGNSAGQAVVHLSRFARRVTLLVRAPSLEKGMSDYLVQQIRHAPNIDVRLDSEVVGAEGGHRIERISVRDATTGAVEVVPVRLVFALIGALPHTGWLDGVVQRDGRGFLVTGADIDPDRWSLSRPPWRFETRMPGVFAAGDVRMGALPRVAAAVGEGAAVVQQLHQYLDHLQERSPGPLPLRRVAGELLEARP
jgi:thioredoxin reductase (NADPH)